MIVVSTSTPPFSSRRRRSVPIETSSGHIADGALGMRYRDGRSRQPEKREISKRAIGKAGGRRYDRDRKPTAVRPGRIVDARAVDVHVAGRPSVYTRGAAAGNLAGGGEILRICYDRRIAWIGC